MTTIPSELRKYELMVIFSGELAESDFEKEFDGLRNTLKELTKGITHEDLWGRRDFAYRLKRQNRGYYVVFNFTAMPDAILEFRQTVKLNPQVLRHLLITVPDDYVPMRYEEILAGLTEKPVVSDKRPRRSLRPPIGAPHLVGPEGVSAAPALAEEKKEPASETKVAGKAEEEKLKSVEKKLEEILDNPDIDIR